MFIFSHARVCPQAAGHDASSSGGLSFAADGLGSLQLASPGSTSPLFSRPQTIAFWLKVNVTGATTTGNQYILWDNRSQNPSGGFVIALQTAPAVRLFLQG